MAGGERGFFNRAHNQSAPALELLVLCFNAAAEVRGLRMPADSVSEGLRTSCESTGVGPRSCGSQTNWLVGRCRRLDCFSVSVGLRELDGERGWFATGLARATVRAGLWCSSSTTLIILAGLAGQHNSTHGPSWQKHGKNCGECLMIELPTSSPPVSFDTGRIDH